MSARTIALAAVLVLFIAACGGDDASSSDATASNDSTTDTAVADTDGTDTADNGATDTAEDTGGSGLDVSASSVGVSEDSVKVGFSYRDLSDLNVGVDNGDFGEIIETLVADVNANGGINGRQVDLVPLGFLPIDETGQQENCIAFTEDEEVFAVLGDFDSESALLCVVDQHETIVVVSGGITDERLSRARAPFLTPSAEVERALEAFVGALQSRGEFDDVTLAVHATSPSDQDMAKAVVIPALEEAGVTVAVESFPVGFPDNAAVTEAMVVELERFREAGVDAIFVVGNDSTTIARTLSDGDYDAVLYVNQVGPTNAFDLMGIDPLVLDGAVGIQAPYQTDRFDDPNAQECFDLWNAAHPDRPVKEEYEEGEANMTVGIGDVCRNWQVFLAAATAAGDELTQKTFLDGAEETGTVGIALHGNGTLGPGKYGAQDEFQLVTWSDPGLGQEGVAIADGWEQAGDLIVFEG